MGDEGWADRAGADANLEPDALRVANGPRRLGSDQHGVAAIEYGLIAALIAVSIIASLVGLGHGVENNWNKVERSVPGNSGIAYKPE